MARQRHPGERRIRIDASKQTTRMSANVSGFANTMRITLNATCCVAVRRGNSGRHGTRDGPLLMNHVYKFIMFLDRTVLAFVYLYWGLGWALQAGRKVADSRRRRHAVLPLVVLLITIFGFVIIRS